MEYLNNIHEMAKDKSCIQDADEFIKIVLQRVAYDLAVEDRDSFIFMAKKCGMNEGWISSVIDTLQ
jgi:hypothetical protein